MDARRLHGRRAALGLFGLSIAFSFFTAFHFDLYAEDVTDYLDLSPTIHAKDILARRLAAASEKDPYAIASAEWEESYETQDNYRNCSMNQPLVRPEHGCATNEDTKIPYCRIQNMRIDTLKISGPLGGEPIESVMGRDEDVELPKYLVGAFSTNKKLKLAENMNRDYWFYLLDVFMAMDIDRRQKCTKTLPGTSLLITRYEYVDLYHTLKDLWNAFMALPEGVTKVDRVIFLDGHAKGWLDDVWKDMFGPTMHVKQIDEGTCLETALFVPPGYSSVLWPLGRLYDANRCISMAKAFVDFVVQAYGLDKIKRQEGVVLIFDPIPHIEHPRSTPDQPSHDSSALLDMQAKILDETDAISVQVIDLHKLSFKSQLKLVRQAHILMGNQDSKLAHVMFLQEGATFIEIKQSGMDMQNIARWIPGLTYKSIFSTSVEIIDYEVVPNVKDVLTPGWDADIRRYPDKYYDYETDYNETEEEWNWNTTDDEFGGARRNDPDMEEEESNEDPLIGWGFQQKIFDKAADYHSCAMNNPYPRPTHGCRVSSDSRVAYCNVENLRIDVSKIDAPAGGEYLDTVLGRAEELEFPTYNAGALTVEKDLDIPTDLDKSMFYYLNDVTSAITTSPGKSCAVTVTEPTLFITRYEYVSLFHSMNDWWNAFFSIPEGDSKKVNLVFLDAHAEGFLDGVWWRVFAKYEFVKQLPEGGVCYKNAIFVPPGYSSVLWPRERVFSEPPCPSMTNAFVDYVVKAYALEDEVVDQGRITIIDRVPFVSHPRRDPSQETQPILNLQRLKEILEKETTATTVEIVDLEQTKFRDQLRIMRQSHIVMGHQEAGLSHLLFLKNGTHVFEFDRSQTMADVAKWKPGVTHRNFDMGDKTLSEDLIMTNVVPSVKYALERQDEKPGASAADKW